TTFSRQVYGIRGNVLHAWLTWAASVCFEVFNGVFGALAWLSFLGLIGFDNTSVAAKLSAGLVPLALGGGARVRGAAPLVFLQRIFAVALGGVFLLVLAWTAPLVHWSHPAPGRLAGLALAAAFMTGCGVVASQPVSYLYNGPDWVRYLPRTTKARSLFHTVF